MSNIQNISTMVSHPLTADMVKYVADQHLQLHQAAYQKEIEGRLKAKIYDQIFKQAQKMPSVTAVNPWGGNPWGGNHFTSTAPASGSISWFNTTNTTTSTISQMGTSSTYIAYDDVSGNSHGYIAPTNALMKGRVYELHDGAKLRIDMQGNYTIEDTEAKVIYKANRVREFNPYLNASDLLEKFIKDMGEEDVRQNELLKLPVSVFIHWLVLQAAVKDGDSTDDLPSLKDVLPIVLPALPAPVKLTKWPRCMSCGRFIFKKYANLQLFVCSPSHMGRVLARV